MSQQPTNSTALAPIDEIRQTLSSTTMADQFLAVMRSKKDVDRFVRVVMTAVQNNPDLLKADRRTFYGACMKAAQDGLLPDGREAVLVIYNINAGTRDNPKWVSAVQYQPMVEGLLKKFRNSGECKGAPNVQTVRVADDFDYALGDNPFISHKPALTNRGPIVGAYSIVKLKDGEISREVMGLDEILQVREKSKSKDAGPWKLGAAGEHTSDFAEMCRKTVFRRHYKRLPKNTDLDNVLKTDNEDYDLEAEPRDVTPRRTEAPPEPASTGGKRKPRRLQQQLQGQGQPMPTAPAQPRESVPAQTPPTVPQNQQSVPTDII